MNTHEQYKGVFLASDSRFSGLLNIDGADSIVKLVGKSVWEYPDPNSMDIHGMLSDGTKASLLECVQENQIQHRVGEDTQYESIFFPNFVAIGEEFINSDEPVITAVRYHFENVGSLLNGQKSFQSLRPNADEMRRILEADYNRDQKIAEEHGWKKQPFDPEVGEHPHLLYFSGQWEVIGFQTNIGKISLTNRTTHNTGNATGIGIDNEVTANIEFTEPKTLNAALHALRVLHGLFELSLGHRQRYRWIDLELSSPTNDVEHEMPLTMRLYWSLCNERVKGNSRVSHHDCLLAPNRSPEEFVKVATGWINSAEMMREPRERFASAFFGTYGIDRIVGAANMFDLLPEGNAPKTKHVDDSLKDAVEQCREIFSKLPQSDAKQSVLSSFGYVGRASLRDKINFRADKISAVAGNKFPDLYLPCRHAVLCRNHYVHGSKGAFDYQDHIQQFIFIMDTLEFVFGVSDLLELGWDLNNWMIRGQSMAHAFSVYTVNYAENLSRLKALVKA